MNDTQTYPQTKEEQQRNYEAEFRLQFLRPIPPKPANLKPQELKWTKPTATSS